MDVVDDEIGESTERTMCSVKKEMRFSDWHEDETGMKMRLGRRSE